ncbi:MAG: glycosyltransferase, partial [Patescibacteria group bacterium]
MYDLSVVIPARNEEWLSKTIQDILEHKEGKTEIIATLDGAWANPGIPQHPDVNIIYVPVATGQRAATNIAVKLSKAKYVMKVD